MFRTSVRMSRYIYNSGRFLVETEIHLDFEIKKLLGATTHTQMLNASAHVVMVLTESLDGVLLVPVEAPRVATNQEQTCCRR